MKASLYIFAIILCGSVAAQKKPAFAWPLDPPHVITGNYGELRPNHFHAGIDFSTRNKINLPVYAIADGYVSRIRVSPYGYGRCIYLTHPGGKVSVYAHLQSFSLKVAALVTRQQYERKSFEVELLPAANSLPVKKGEVIGLSGNSGGSSGPHLHFEIRDEQSEVPLNALQHYDISDPVPPLAQSIAVFNLSDTCSARFIRTFRIEVRGDTTYPTPKDIVVDESVIGIAFAGYDRLAEKGNANNVYAASLFFDGRLIYAHELNGIAFEDNRYVNEFSEQVQRTKYQKCFLPTLYPKGIYTAHVSRGRIVLKDTSFHRVLLELRDEKGNRSQVAFRIRTSKLTGYTRPVLNSNLFIECNRNFTVATNGIYMKIPKGTLYNSTPLIIGNDMVTASKISVFPEVNLRSAALLGFRLPPELRTDAAKLVLKGSTGVYNAIVRNDSAFFQLKSFGQFHIYTDLQSPQIEYRKPHRRRHTQQVRSVSFRISDKLSGIASYAVHLNNAWVLAEYDAKNDLLSYYFDDSTPKGTLRFVVTVSDQAGNSSTLEQSIRR